MTETDAEKAYVKLQQAQDCYHTEPWPQLKVLEHEMGGTYHHEDLDLGLAPGARATATRSLRSAVQTSAWSRFLTVLPPQVGIGGSNGVCPLSPWRRHPAQLKPLGAPEPASGGAGDRRRRETGAALSRRRNSRCRSWCTASVFRGRELADAAAALIEPGPFRRRFHLPHWTCAAPTPGPPAEYARRCIVAGGVVVLSGCGGSELRRAMNDVIDQRAAGAAGDCAVRCLNFASDELPVSAPKSSILRHVSDCAGRRGQRVQGPDQVAQVAVAPHPPEARGSASTRALATQR